MARSKPREVVFLQVGEDQALARAMVASVRATSPAFRVVQLSDRATSGVEGVDEVVRGDYDGERLMMFRARMCAGLDGCERVLLDTDLRVQTNLGQVFDQLAGYDLILTNRYAKVMDAQGMDVSAACPFNGGVVFARGRRPWWRILREMERMPADLQKWWGDQLALVKVHAMPDIAAAVIPGLEWNYTPKSPDEDVSKKAIVHYKGQRKDWMLAKAA